MKPLTTILIACAMGLALTQPLYSQARIQRPVKEELQALKVANQKLLEQQAATLLKLDDTVKEASQLRIMVRRT